MRKILSLLFVALLMPFAAAQKIERINSNSSGSGGIRPLPTTSAPGLKQTNNTQKTAVPEVDGQNVTASPNNIIAALPKQPVRDWVIMYYINPTADFTADAAFMENIADLETVGTTDKVAIVVEMYRNAQTAFENFKYISTNAKFYEQDYQSVYEWDGVRRFLIQKNEEHAKIGNLSGANGKPSARKTVKTNNFPWVSHILAEHKKDIGDYRTLVSYVKWTKKNFPARHYMLVLLASSMGYLDPIASSTKGVGLNQKQTNYIRTTQLPRILKEVGGIDVLVSPVGAINNMETIYQARGQVKYMVSSTKEPNFINDKSDILSVAQAIDRGGAVDPKTAAGLVYKAASVSFDEYFAMVGIDVTQVAQFMNALNEWTQTVMGAPANEIVPVIQAAKKEVTRFEYESRTDISTYADLRNFVDLVAAKSKDQTVKQSSQKFAAAIKKLIAFYPNFEKKTISVGLPAVQHLGPEFTNVLFETPYDEYPFAKESNWGNFYKWVESLPQNGKTK